MSAHHSEYIGSLETRSEICVNCHRQLRLALIEAEVVGDELHIRKFFMPCPCIAEKKGITSELPQQAQEGR